MGAPRRKNLLIASRRRVDDEGEDEEGSIPNGLDDDSLSEGSAMSDADDDADAEASEASDVESMEPKNTRVGPGINGYTEKLGDQTSKPSLLSMKTPQALVMHDTDAMMNGLKFAEDGDGEDEVHFDEMGKQSHAELVIQATVDSQVEPVIGDTMGERRRREHEEYKRKRDTDPAFVPNRGGFFMHDHRSALPGHNGFRPFVKGRGRGRGAMDGSSPTFRYDLEDFISQRRSITTKYCTDKVLNLLGLPTYSGHTIYTKRSRSLPLRSTFSKLSRCNQTHKIFPSFRQLSPRNTPQTDHFPKRHR